MKFEFQTNNTIFNTISQILHGIYLYLKIMHFFIWNSHFRWASCILSGKSVLWGVRIWACAQALREKQPLLLLPFWQFLSLWALPHSEFLNKVLSGQRADRTQLLFLLLPTLFQAKVESREALGILCSHESAFTRINRQHLAELDPSRSPFPKALESPGHIWNLSALLLPHSYSVAQH